MKKILKQLLPQKAYSLLKWIKYLRYSYGIYKNARLFKLHHNKVIFLLFTPEHSNLGDHAIALAELRLLSDYDVFEITGADLLILSRYTFLLKKLFKNDTLIFQGGGYLGTIWYDAELLLRKVFSVVGKSNRIVVFPQTIYYEDSEWGNEEFEKSKEIYNSCSKLVLTAREKESFYIMKSAYKNVYLIPDVVLSLTSFSNNTNCQRSRVSVCLRNDVEKTMSDDEREKIIAFCHQLYGENVRFFDMCAEYSIKPKDRERELEKQFDKFRSSELVITDRLHGMIFAAITGTPCIVLNSKSPKVKGIYDWIFEDCEYVTFTDDFKHMEEFIEKTRGKTYSYDNCEITHYYNELINLVKED